MPGRIPVPNRSLSSSTYRRRHFRASRERGGSTAKVTNRHPQQAFDVGHRTHEHRAKEAATDVRAVARRARPIVDRGAAWPGTRGRAFRELWKYDMLHHAIWQLDTP
jgi:hypothetical protein